jgi:dephospho-CoA kinase
MLRVALTGGIATGKSYVRARFEALGVPTIDADAVARAAVEPGAPALARIAERFGPRVVREDGRLDREALAAVVFADTGARRALEAIVHPEVRRVIHDWEAALSACDPAERPAYCLADIPLLYETGRAADYDVVIVTACAPDEQVRRVRARDGASEAEARARLAAQWPIDAKTSRADYVIRTDGTFADTDARVAAVHVGLLERARAPQ